MSTPSSLLDAHVDTFRGDLLRASSRLTTRRRRTRRGFTLAVPLAAAATLAIAFWPSGKVDVLQRAAAALRPETGVIYFRVNSGPIGMRAPVCAEAPSDVWLETRPRLGEHPRWRYRHNSARCTEEGVEQGQGHILTGRSEVWFNGKDRSTRGIDDGWVETLTDVPNSDRDLPPITQLNGTGNEDPLKTLRDLYTSGKVHPAGSGSIDGRRVRFFEGPFDVTALDDTVRIAVDDKTFAPVEVRVAAKETPELAKRPSNQGLGFWLRFDAYEKGDERDLTPEIPAGTDQVSIDYRAFRREVRRTGHYPPTPISAAERARAEQRLKDGGN